MAQREGNVFLYAFIPTFVLLVGAIVVIFYQNAELESARDSYEELVADVRPSEIRPVKVLQKVAQDHLKELDALKELVGGPGAADAWPGNEHFSSKLQEAEAKYNEVATSLDLEARSFEYLEAPYGDVVDMIAQLKEQWDRANETSNYNQEQVVKVETSHQESLNKLDTELADLQKKFQTLQAQSEDTELASTKKVTQLTTELEDLREDVGRNEIKYRQELAYKDNKYRNVSAQLTRLREQVRKIETVEDIEPDGKIVDVESRSRTAWINLGSSNHMRPGLVFKVFQYAGGKKLWKGSVEVRQVNEKFSQVHIVSESDSLNPIAANDQVTNPFYDPKASPSFVFAGESTEIDLTSVRSKLETWGAKVGKKVDHSTDFLVALRDYDQTAEYLAARELGVVIIREKDLLEYLGQ
jgi:NAD-dependent DNA ligase